MLIEIAFCVDAANLQQAAVVIASVANSSAPGNRHQFHLVYDGVEGSDLNKFRKATKGRDVVVHFAATRFDKHAPIGHISSAALLRTQLPNILKDAPRVLYFDADLIIRRDLGDLFSTELDGCAVAGVVDIGMYALIGRLMAQGENAMLGHMAKTVGLDPARAQYVNSGMLLMDLNALRAISFAEHATEVFDRRGNEFIWRDQDLINHLLAGKVKQIDPRWNVLASFMLDDDGKKHVPAMLKEAFAAQEREQWIIHYTAEDKPWNSQNVWQRQVWWDVANLLKIDWPKPKAPKAEWPPLQAARKAYRTILPVSLRQKIVPAKIVVQNVMRRLRGRPPIIDSVTEIKRSRKSSAT